MGIVQNFSHLERHGGLFSKAAYADIISWNGSVALKFIPGQPQKRIFVVT